MAAARLRTLCNALNTEAMTSFTVILAYGAGRSRSSAPALPMPGRATLRTIPWLQPGVDTSSPSFPRTSSEHSATRADALTAVPWDGKRARQGGGLGGSGLQVDDHLLTLLQKAVRLAQHFSPSCRASVRNRRDLQDPDCLEAMLQKGLATGSQIKNCQLTFALVSITLAKTCCMISWSQWSLAKLGVGFADREGRAPPVLLLDTV